MSKTLLKLALLFSLPINAAQEPVIGGPCQGCELVYVDMPDNLQSTTTMVDESEPGEAMVISGSVFDLVGNVVPNTIVYAYQTNAAGVYPKSKTQHGALRGWVKTDNKGQFIFQTIRPGSYPGRDSPQHVHLHVIEPGKGTYYIDDVTFTDDVLLTPSQRARKPCRSGCGFATPVKRNGVWYVQRNIILGQSIPNYR